MMGGVDIGWDGVCDIKIPIVCLYYRYAVDSFDIRSRDTKEPVYLPPIYTDSLFNYKS